MEELFFGSNLIGVVIIFLATTLITLIIVIYEMNECKDKIVKDVSIIAVVVILGFASYANFKIKKLANNSEIVTLANSEEVLTNTEYIHQNEVINQSEYAPINVDDNSYVILVNDNNEGVEEKVYYKNFSTLISYDNIKDEEKTDRVETYSLNKIYRINDKLSILDKLSLKFLNISTDLDEYEYIETINNYNHKIFVSENDYNYIKNAESEMNLAKS